MACRYNILRNYRAITESKSDYLKSLKVTCIMSSKYAYKLNIEPLMENIEKHRIFSSIHPALV